MTPYDSETARDMREMERRNAARINNRTLKRQLFACWLSIQAFFQPLAFIIETDPENKHPQTTTGFLITAGCMLLMLGAPSAFGCALYYDSESAKV